MRLHRFYINQKIENSVLVKDGNLINQWLRVFRLKVGDRIILFCGDCFEYETEFVSLKKDEVVLKIISKKENLNQPKKEIVLFASLIKKDNFEWVVEKCTELGVSKFQPIISERSEKKNLNIERLKIIAREAVEQSGRTKIPEILNLENLEDVLNKIKPENSIAFDSFGVDFNSKNFQIKSCNLFVGPEGGFSEKEIELFKSKNIPIFSLGNFTLRAETASVAISSLLLL